MATGRAYRAWLMTRQASALARRTARRRLGFESTVYVHQRNDEYRGYWERAAQSVGAGFRELAPGYWEVERGGRHTRMSPSALQFNDQVVASMCANKALSYDLAVSLGVPVPPHAIFSLEDLPAARRHLASSPGTYVVKPANDTSAGIGVSTFVRTRSELNRAAILASLFNPQFLLERMIPGESCRLLLLDGELVHAVRRRGVRVTGDGQSQLATLLQRAGGRLDEVARWTLAGQDLSPETVPNAGLEVLARAWPAATTQVRELRTIYSEEITTQVGQELVAAGARLSAALEARLAGVDVVTTDPRRALAETGGAVLEVNPQPGIHHHYIGDGASGERVAVRLLEALLAG